MPASSQSTTEQAGTQVTDLCGAQTQVCVPRLLIGLSKLLTFFENRKPSATAPGVAAAGTIDRAARNVSLVAQRDVDRDLYAHRLH